MRKKWLFGVLSLLLVLGFSGPVSAGWEYDACEDGPDTVFVPDKDLYRAKVEIFPDPDRPEDPWAYFCFEMCPGSSMPGIVIWELDVDHDVNTGGSHSMTGQTMDPCPCKERPGYDIVIMKAYRDQGTQSSSSWCRGFGTLAECAEDMHNPDCGTTNCSQYLDKTSCNALPQGTECRWSGDGVCTFRWFDLGPSCYTNDPNCRKFGSQGSAPYENCHLNQKTCPAGPTGLGRKAGEWWANLTESDEGAVAGAFPIDWGRAIPKPPPACTGDGIGWCEKLPWGEIVRDAKAACGTFDLHQALTTLPEWQIAVYYDTTFQRICNEASPKAGEPCDFNQDCYDGTNYGVGQKAACIGNAPISDEDDYMDINTQDPSASLVNISDWLPDGDYTDADAQPTDGGVCHELQRKFHCCLDEMAEGAIFTPYSVCSGYDQTECEADDGCTWRGSSCLSNVCLMEASGDGKITAPDYAIFKKEFGRAGCPCSN